jgi:hypothetical protein
VHHRHQTTPNLRRPRRPGHAHALDSTLPPRRSRSRAWGEELSRDLLAHARPPSPSLTSTPRRPEPPLRGRTPAGCRSGQQRTRATRQVQTSKSTIHAVGRVHTATPANADAERHAIALSLALDHRAPPRAYLACTTPPAHGFFRQTAPPPPTHSPEAPQGELASLPSGEGARRPRSTREEGRLGDRFRPNPAALLPLHSPSF